MSSQPTTVRPVVQVEVGQPQPVRTPDVETPQVEPSGSLDLRSRGRGGDALFAGLSRGAGIVIILMVAFVGAFLVWRAVPALRADQASFLFSREWSPSTTPPRFGVLGLLYTTVLLSAFAMVLAVPVAIGVALFVTQYAPVRLARPVASLVDLLAAVPSIVYGLWGAAALAPRIKPVGDWVTGHLGTWPVTSWFPLWKPGIADAGTIFAAGVVLAIMILPITTAICREVFAQTPVAHREGALALGATRWEMIRLAVLPYGRSGAVSGAMLGLGRALGETIAVLIVLSVPFQGSVFNASLFNGGETFASKIAANAAEFNSPTQTGAFIAAGLVLFVVTFAVNAIARLVVERGRRRLE